MVGEQVLAPDADGLGGTVVVLAGGGDGMPVTSHEFAHGRALADGGEALIMFDGEHRFSPLTTGSLDPGSKPGRLTRAGWFVYRRPLLAES